MKKYHNKIITTGKKWVLFWGIFLDEDKEIHKIINQYNEDGWRVIQIDWSSAKEKSLLTYITLGFIFRFVGISVVLEKENEEV